MEKRDHTASVVPCPRVAPAWQERPPGFRSPKEDVVDSESCGVSEETGLLELGRHRVPQEGRASAGGSKGLGPPSAPKKKKKSEF